MQSYDIPLHDIKPLVIIEEYSLYYFIGTLVLGVLFVLLFIYLGYKIYKKLTGKNQRKEYKALLNTLDMSDTKKTAYAISFYGNIFKDDSPANKEMYENITQRLESYKYKKNVDSFDEETLGYIEIYKEMIDV